MDKTSELGRNWESRNIPERKIYEFINEFEISELLSRILIGRNVASADVLDFLEPKIKNLMPDPFHLLDMQKACERTAQSILKNEKIIVLGDYDVDGATSSALLIRFFKSLGISAKVYIPDRIREGYGPTLPIIRKFQAEGANLVITVDCGITAFEPMKEAKTLNLDVIILDHHMSDIILPEAYAIVNPNRFDEATKYRDLAAVGVAFLFAVGVIKILRGKNFFEKIDEPDLLKLLDLVALGTICDMMNLTGLNRAFVIQGLKIMEKQENIGLKILAEAGKVDSKPNPYHLGFIIGPRINAGGRVGKSFLGSLLLSTSNEDDAVQYALELERYNEERKIIEQQVLDEAYELAEVQSHKNYILVYAENWHPGVVGIVAGKLKERFQKPVAAMAIEDGIGKASCRSVRGIDFGSKIVEAKNREILLSGGGHSMAAGFTLKIDKLDELIAFFDESMLKESDVLHKNNTCFYDVEISPSGFNIELASEIQKLEPYGNGNSEPIIKIANLFVLKANIVNNKHINCLLAPDREAYGSKAIRAISFNSVGTVIGDALLHKNANKLTVFGNIKLNNWQGRSNAQLYIHDIIIE